MNIYNIHIHLPSVSIETVETASLTQLLDPLQEDGN